MEFVTVAIIAYGPLGNAYALAGPRRTASILSAQTDGGGPGANPPPLDETAVGRPATTPGESSRPPPRP